MTNAEQIKWLNAHGIEWTLVDNVVMAADHTVRAGRDERTWVPAPTTRRAMLDWLGY